MMASFGLILIVLALSCAHQNPQPSGPIAPATQESVESTPATLPSEAPATRPTTRASIRPLLEPAQYAELAQSLRAQYARPSNEWPTPDVDPEVKYRELGLLEAVEFPRDNIYSGAKATLGKMLFFDPRLSGSGQIACASCHDPDLGWTDGRTVSFGHDRKVLKRHAPSLLNVAYEKSLFWDGRAESLEAQAIVPIGNEDEMRGDWEKIAARLEEIEEYRQRFAAAFGTEEVNEQRVGQALATFERLIVGGRSRFDAFLKGKSEALSDSAVRGLHLFRTAARCANCHNGPNFTDNQFHDLGLSYYGRTLQDLGRYVVTDQPADVGRFKTPTLRNVARTAPYMHVGLFDMDGVLNLYNAGMPTLRRKPDQLNDPLFPTKSPLLNPLGLNRQDFLDLKAFLESVNEPRQRVRPPALPGLNGAPSTRPAATQTSQPIETEEVEPEK